MATGSTSREGRPRKVLSKRTNIAKAWTVVMQAPLVVAILRQGALTIAGGQGKVASMARSRQALILIHGIGEQLPMDTMRSFIDAVLDQGPSTSQTKAKYYSKPDLLSDNLELRRLVSAGESVDRTDFYEFYWAHLMPTATWGRLASWYWVLMQRRPKDVPAQVKLFYVVSWLIFIAVIGFGLYTASRYFLGYAVAADLQDAPWLLIVAGGILSAVIRSYVGDAAVYLSPSPANIEARQKIRASGLALLDRVVASGRYDRIIIVGHSLGSVIAYDVLTFAWQRHSENLRHSISAAWRKGTVPQRAMTALRAAERAAKQIRDTQNATPATMAALAADWRRATRAVDAEQRANGDGWLVTDLVTLGSPLTHGALLLAKDRADFERRTRERELPHSPPVRELNGKFSYTHEGSDDKGGPQQAIILNHAAVFAVVGWTNIFFPCRYLLKGDLVGGPVAPLFWPGVRDIPVDTRIWGGWLAHTHYWQHWQRHAADTNPETAPVPRLREALDLGRQQPWPPATPAMLSAAAAVVPAAVAATPPADEPGAEEPEPQS